MKNHIADMDDEIERDAEEKALADTAIPQPPTVQRNELGQLLPGSVLNTGGKAPGTKRKFTKILEDMGAKEGSVLGIPKKAAVALAEKVWAGVLTGTIPLERLPEDDRIELSTIAARLLREDEELVGAVSRLARKLSKKVGAEIDADAEITEDELLRAFLEFSPQGRTMALTSKEWIDLVKWFYRQVDGPAPAQIDLTSKGEQLGAFIFLPENDRDDTNLPIINISDIEDAEFSESDNDPPHS